MQAIGVCARLARRDHGAYWTYSTEKQRSSAGMHRRLNVARVLPRGEKCSLEQIVAFPRLQLLHKIRDALSLLPRADQQRIRSIHDDEILHADQCCELAWGLDIVAVGVDFMYRSPARRFFGLFRAVAGRRLPNSPCRSNQNPDRRIRGHSWRAPTRHSRWIGSRNRRSDAVAMP